MPKERDIKMLTDSLTYKGALTMRANAPTVSGHLVPWNTEGLTDRRAICVDDCWQFWVEDSRIYTPFSVGLVPGMFKMAPFEFLNPLGKAADEASARFELWELPHSVKVMSGGRVLAEVTPFMLKASNGCFVGHYGGYFFGQTLGAPQEGGFSGVFLGKMPVPAEWRTGWDGTVWSILFSLQLNLFDPEPSSAEIGKYMAAWRVPPDAAIPYNTMGGRILVGQQDADDRSTPNYFFALSLTAAPQWVTPLPVAPPMNFKFKGKFALRANALTVDFHFEENPKRFVEDSRSYTETDIGLVPGACNPYWGNLENALGASPDDLNSYFTVWEADQPVGITSGGAAIPFILRARNGMYIRAAGTNNVTLAATATDQNDALMFGSHGIWENGAVLFGLKVSPSDSTSAEMLGYVLAQHTLKNQPESRIFLFLSKVAATEPACSFRLRQTPPFLTDLQQWKAAQGSDLSWMDWAGADLSEVQMNDADLTGINLAHANLTRAILTGANLNHAILGPFTRLDEAVLIGAQLDGADFHYSFFRKTVFGDNPNLTNTNLSAADFCLINLKGAIFDSANLVAVTMRYCDLSGLDFTKIKDKDLHNASFQKSNLQGAKFSGCDLNGANFQDADLTGARLDNIKGNDFIFRGSILVGTDFSHSTLVPHGPAEPWCWHAGAQCDPVPRFSQDPNNLTKFVGATVGFQILNLNWSCLDLTDATIVDLPQDLAELQATHLTAKGIDLSNRNLTNAVFNNADLTNAIFTDSDLTGAKFIGAKLYGATFSYATLNGADFTDAQLGTIESSGTPIRAAVLSYANMRDAVFTNANLNGCMLNGVQWYGEKAKASNARFTNTKISEANLSGINLKEATLDQADFAGTILVNADLSGAKAPGTGFTDAHLQGAKFNGAILNGADFTNAAVALDKGVPLFRVDAIPLITDLDAAHLSENLKKAFKVKGFPLLDNPTVQVVTAGTEWTVSNATSAMPLTGLGSMYEKFTLIHTASGSLQVFGSTLWVTQVKGAELQSIPVPCLPSALDQATCTMDDSMVFPSGLKLPQFKAEKFTWEQMMTSRTPLVPPKCVYTPGSWGCHPTQRAS